MEDFIWNKLFKMVYVGFKNWPLLRLMCFELIPHLNNLCRTYLCEDCSIIVIIHRIINIKINTILFNTLLIAFLLENLKF